MVTSLIATAVQSLERRPPDFVLPPRPQGGGEVAVEVVARLAHQVHEAIGSTQAHRLHHLTRRLWWWRDGAGDELMWRWVRGARLLVDGTGGPRSTLTRVV